MKTGIFNLTRKDFFKSLLMFLGTALLTYLQTLIPTLKNIPLELQAAISAGITYIIKNFLTPTNKEAAITVKEQAFEEGKSYKDVVETLTK